MVKRHSRDNTHSVYVRSCQRHYIMKEILDSISYQHESTIRNRIWPWFHRANPGSFIRLEKLLEEKIFHAAFPLHEVVWVISINFSGKGIFVNILIPREISSMPNLTDFLAMIQESTRKKYLESIARYYTTTGLRGIVCLNSSRLMRLRAILAQK